MACLYEVVVIGFSGCLRVVKVSLDSLVEMLIFGQIQG